MTSLLKSLAMKVPAFSRHQDRVAKLMLDHDRLARKVEELSALAADRNDLAQQVEKLRADRDRLAREVAELTRRFGLTPVYGEIPPEDWSYLKQCKRKMSEAFRAVAAVSRLSPIIQPAEDHLNKTMADLIAYKINAEPYWFQKIEVLPGVYTPGWSDPEREKLPYYGLPEDLTGKRVLDIGCAEGFFSFEPEKRGAREVIGIDSYPDSVRRFNIVKAARQSNADAFLMNVYDLEPRRLGTFDLVLFYGVFYHLKHPQRALEQIRSVCTGSLLFQTAISEEPSVRGMPWARFCPHGLLSGSNKDWCDPTVFWLFNSTCCLAMLDHVGFTDVKIISRDPFVVSATSPEQAPGIPPDQTDSPWS